VVVYVNENPGAKANDIATALRIPQRILERWLKLLKEEGKIEFRGAPKTGGYYTKKTN